MSNAMQSEKTKQGVNPEDLKQVWYMHYDPYGPVGTLYVLEGGLNYLQPIVELKHNAQHYGQEYDYLREPEVLYACEEGVYQWNEAKEDYDFVGGIIETVRKKYIIIRHDITVKHRNDIMHLKRNEEYEVKKEYITYHKGAEPDVVYVLQGRGTAPFELAYDKKTQTLMKEDLALIDPNAKDWGSHVVRICMTPCACNSEDSTPV